MECVEECVEPTPSWNGTICEGCSDGTTWDGRGCTSYNCDEGEYWDGDSCLTVEKTLTF